MGERKGEYGLEKNYKEEEGVITDERWTEEERSLRERLDFNPV